MQRKIKIYIDGADNTGWSIDNDRKHIIDYINSSDSFEIVDSYKKSDIIHNIWWNSLLNNIPELINRKKSFFKRYPKIIVTCSNFIDPGLAEFDLFNELNTVKKIADGWICPSTIQMKILDSMGFKTYYLPFSVDRELFKPVGNISKKDICNVFGIDYKKISNKIVIGSFQRDSLGSDLSKPKWQKGPELLIDLLKDLPSDKFILLLAGPRRHYVINQCKEYNIPYCYAGHETANDDLMDNAFPIEKMPWLYKLADIYLITSKSEGGPKAAIEATATRTFIMSTNVGLASDFIDERFVFNSHSSFKNTLADIVENFINKNNIINEVVESNFQTYLQILNENVMKKRLLEIYRKVLKG